MDTGGTLHPKPKNLSRANANDRLPCTPAILPTLNGWVDQPNQRGTIDIVWSCVTTLAICCSVMIHLNVPAKRDTQWTLTFRKARWLTLALLAPEIVMLFASGQWASA